MEGTYIYILIALNIYSGLKVTLVLMLLVPVNNVLSNLDVSWTEIVLNRGENVLFKGITQCLWRGSKQGPLNLKYANLAVPLSQCCIKCPTWTARFYATSHPLVVPEMFAASRKMSPDWDVSQINVIICENGFKIELLHLPSTYPNHYCAYQLFLTHFFGSKINHTS